MRLRLAVSMPWRLTPSAMIEAPFAGPKQEDLASGREAAEAHAACVSRRTPRGRGMESCSPMANSYRSPIARRVMPPSWPSPLPGRCNELGAGLLEGPESVWFAGMLRTPVSSGRLV